MRARSGMRIDTLVRKIARVCVGKQDVCGLFGIFGTNATTKKHLNSPARRGWFYVESQNITREKPFTRTCL